MIHRSFLAGCLLLAACAAQAQSAAADLGPQNVLQLSATGTVEVQQDLLSLVLSTSREGADANAVQTQLKTALEAAVTEARRQAQPGQLDVRTGNFSIYPRHDRNGKATGWAGTAELVLEGRDFQRITQAASRVTTLTTAGVSFGLSREQRQRVEGDAQTQAIERFKAKAGELARAFGFASYTLREVNVNSHDTAPRPKMLAMERSAAAVADAALPVEAGRSTVVVTVSGSVQLR